MAPGDQNSDASDAPRAIPLDSIRLTVLFDNYGHDEAFGTGWGFSCLVEGAQRTILFDTGSDGKVLMRNLEAAGIDPARIDDVFISHDHWDHTGGLFDVLAANGDLTVYAPASVAERFAKELLELGVTLVRVDSSRTICPAVHSTGEMGHAIREQSLVVETDAGLIVVTGCAHPGIVDIVERAHGMGRGGIFFVFGGFHLGDLDAGGIERIISRFKELGIRYAGPSHCTGDRAIAAFRDAFGARCIAIGSGRVLTADDFE
jgi:7,8-dihydropterin-6-yl-methyl-4-(beta-D-ribofuranosyl)aminobenzene 5'-phosphate synthase